MPKNHRNYQKTRHIALSGLLLFAGSLMVWLVSSVKTFHVPTMESRTFAQLAIRMQLHGSGASRSSVPSCPSSLFIPEQAGTGILP